MTAARKRKPTQAQRERVFKRAMEMSVVMLRSTGDLRFLRGNNGLLAKLLRACESASGKGRGRG